MVCWIKWSKSRRFVGPNIILFLSYASATQMRTLALPLVFPLARAARLVTWYMNSLGGLPRRYFYSMDNRLGSPSVLLHLSLLIQTIFHCGVVSWMYLIVCRTEVKLSCVRLYRLSVMKKRCIIKKNSWIASQ